MGNATTQIGKMTTEDYRRVLQHLPIFGLVMDFCRQLILRILDEQLYDAKSFGSDGKVYQKAIFDMLLRDPRNIETFILQDYDEIRFSEHKGKMDKNGKIRKLQSVRADFVKRKITYTKV